MSDTAIRRLRAVAWKATEYVPPAVYLADAERILREELTADRECVYTEDDPDMVWTCSACGFGVSVGGSPTSEGYAYCPHCGARITESRAYVPEEDET